ncbi:N-alpha-acetyltransferase 60 isoform X2 [Etheostoma cragini]|uniref:N-alpha-acetyltransferase 60 isoform X2 n=1 Tax=Etheostoma cragini TaxID=417921 RepID=UPI00155E03F1|nr:N-alpha-acetyltransferase 60 isoform X2 [Etheostoma cragini]
MSDVVPPTALSEVQLRFLCHDDIDNVKLLCGDWFPIEYPESWYQDITSNKKFFSLAATFRGGIVGMIVAEIKGRTKVHKEGPTDYIQHIGSTLASLSPCSLPQRLYRQAQSLLRSLLPWSNIASKTGIQYSRTM